MARRFIRPFALEPTLVEFTGSTGLPVLVDPNQVARVAAAGANGTEIALRDTAMPMMVNATLVVASVQIVREPIAEVLEALGYTEAITVNG